MQEGLLQDRQFNEQYILETIGNEASVPVPSNREPPSQIQDCLTNGNNEERPSANSGGVQAPMEQRLQELNGGQDMVVAPVMGTKKEISGQRSDSSSSSDSDSSCGTLSDDEIERMLSRKKASIKT
jgi:hypothetical protein